MRPIDHILIDQVIVHRKTELFEGDIHYHTQSDHYIDTITIFSFATAMTGCET